MQQNQKAMSLHTDKKIMLSNIIFDKRNLRRAKTFDYLLSSIKITKYSTNKFVMVSALANTGAQSNLWRWKNFQDAGFGKNNLLPVSIKVKMWGKARLPTCSNFVLNLLFDANKACFWFLNNWNQAPYKN